MYPGIDRLAGRRLFPGQLARRHPSRVGSPERNRRPIAVAGLVAASGRGSAGHSVGHFPSYYPDEIHIDVDRTGRRRERP